MVVHEIHWAEILFRSCKNLDKIYCNSFEPKIRETKHGLSIKLVTLIDGKLQEKSIKPN